MESVKKIVGVDCELSNTLQIAGCTDGFPERASALLLEHTPGHPRRDPRSGTAIEMGRAFLANGGSRYIDADHYEINLPEHLSSAEHPKILHGMLRVARRAQQAANRQLGGRARLTVVANNSDGRTSWGHHTSLLTTAAAFVDVCGAKPHLAGFLAAHLVTSNLYAGQGLVGPANDRGPVDFQLSQRADWFETFAAVQTTYQRPIINLRAEHHAADGLARLHLIFHDVVLSPAASRLQIGTLQLVMAMIEQHYIDVTLLLDDPVAAAAQVSRDLSLRETLPTAVRRRRLTALEVQRALADLAGEFVGEGLAEGIVPEAPQIVADWHAMLDVLERRDLDALARRTDCWLKYRLLNRFRGRKGLTWSSPQIKMLDFLFGSLDPEQGLFFQTAAAGEVDDLPTEAEIERAADLPPEETRAYLRGRLLQRYGRCVSHMDWSYMAFRVPNGDGRQWSRVARLAMDDPAAQHRAAVEPLLDRYDTLEELVEALGSSAAPRSAVPSASPAS